MEKNSSKNLTNNEKLNKLNNSGNIDQLYVKIYNGYRKHTQKERTFQIILFIIELIMIFLLVLNFFLSLFRTNANQLFDFGGLLFQIPDIPIVILGFYQFRIIIKWNKSASLPDSSLVKSHYTIINQLNKLMIVSALILGIASYILLTQFISPSIIFVPHPPKENFSFFIDFMRWLSIIMILSYIVLESIYIKRWLTKIKSINKIEHLIMNELVEFLDLTNEKID
ncbi:MAG: hypothetical protein EAX96_10995 [Candidatus Lokiarchaeota archaeon]|nr:hypothetical protein [Candidatus Lokiarchaeota archaeon]